MSPSLIRGDRFIEVPQDKRGYALPGKGWLFSFPRNEYMNKLYPWLLQSSFLYWNKLDARKRILAAVYAAESFHSVLSAHLHRWSLLPGNIGRLLMNNDPFWKESRTFFNFFQIHANFFITNEKLNSCSIKELG